MASLDYLWCLRCGGKAVYDGNDYLRGHESAVAALCPKCREFAVLVVKERTDKDGGGTRKKRTK